MKKLFKVAAVSSLAIALAACHTGPQSPEAVAGAENGAKAYGIGQKGGLSGADVDGANGALAGRHVNVLSAPANQVYYFSFNQSGVSPSDMQAITTQANYLVTHRNAKVRLEGNADDRGSREYNIGLGWRRARAVESVLKQQGVAANQIKTISYGKEHPAVSGDNEHAWTLNRRVELIYVQK
jgi:peptidoglycan-associated lipoprotein